MSLYGVVIFSSTSAAMRGDKLLAAEGMQTRIIPTPRQFSHDCGIALSFDWDDGEKVEILLREARVRFDGVHFLGADEV